LDETGDSELARLMRAALAGDEKAYRAFLGRAGDLVRRFARRRIVDGAIDPEDIVQETLLAIHLKRHTWRADMPIEPWIAAIARHKLVDAFRRRGRHVDVDIDAMAETFAAPVAETLAQREVDRALDTLSPGQRTVVAAVSLDGRSIRETAEQLGMSEGAVRVALHRGLAAIAKHFGRRHGRD